jgi:hypothetical protein
MNATTNGSPYQVDTASMCSMEAGVPLDPGLISRVLMGTVIVDDQMQIHSRPGCIFFESRQTEPQKPLPPKLHRWPRKFKRPCHFLALYVVGGHLNYLRALNNTRWHGSAASPSIQNLCLGWRKYDGSCSSGHESHHTPF